jgi:hypothetical protein
MSRTTCTLSNKDGNFAQLTAREICSLETVRSAINIVSNQGSEKWYEMVLSLGDLVFIQLPVMLLT